MLADGGQIALLFVEEFELDEGSEIAWVGEEEFEQTSRRVHPLFFLSGWRGGGA